MAPTDQYYHAAKQAGYRSRAAFKLKQLDAEVDLLGDGDVVVDLGAAPGGWLQVAADEVGANGRVIGVDLASIDPLVESEATVETIQADLTADDTREQIRALVGDRGVDVVLSDMAPEMTGEYSVDQARSVHLARQAAAVADDLLRPDGIAVVKVFQGRDLDAFRDDFESRFDLVRTMSPPASRDASSEVYLVGKGHLAGPVNTGDTREVTIVDEGDKGDGIARIDGYTVFVPETAIGDTVRIRITDTKPTYAFAERVD